ncbi:nucleoporin NUP42-like [Bacillus rossius redtenbacheri]|uniref:nucleoporin NUP42-like n=1 Tax=Bacillus rossius redtenbacheri TaxID=93214 RepID=UPI002FDD1FCA
MVVCKYYQQGYCKFGDTCRFEHLTTYGSHYFQNRNPPSLPSGKISQELQEAIRNVQDDIMRGEKGGQWPLSCYAPFKQRACIPDWQDVSPEEVRLMFYQAAQTGNLETCKSQVKGLLRNAELRRAQLLNSNPETYSLLDKIYKGDNEDPKNCSFVQSSNSSATEALGGSFLFAGGQPTLVSGNVNNFKFAVPHFEQGQTYTAFETSPFGAQNLNTDFQQQSTFGNAPVQQGNVFGSSLGHAKPSSVLEWNSQSNVFSQQIPSAVHFSFDVPVASEPSNDLNSGKFFGSSSVNASTESPSITKPLASSSEDTFVYSQRSELTEEEITQFMTPTFSLSAGKIPSKPPSKDLCL